MSLPASVTRTASRLREAGFEVTVSEKEAPEGHLNFLSGINPERTRAVIGVWLTKSDKAASMQGLLVADTEGSRRIPANALASWLAR